MADRPIYLDCAATSPVDPRVVEAMAACLTQDGVFGNPASPHLEGGRARRVVERAREQIGALVHAAPDRLVFTSGAAESNNLALRGLLAGGGQLVTTRIEHRSVLDPAEALAARGVDLVLLGCDGEGIVAPETVGAAIGPLVRSSYHADRQAHEAGVAAG